MLLCLHALELENFQVAFPRKPKQKRQRKDVSAKNASPRRAAVAASSGAGGASPSSAAAPMSESVAAAAAAPSPDFIEATEKHIARSIKSYQFFEDAARKRRASRLTKL